MRLIRFLAGDGEPRVGILSQADEGGTGTVTVLAAVGSLGELLALPLAEIRQICASPAGEAVRAAEVQLLAPAEQSVEELLADPRTLPASAVIERTEYALAGRFAAIATIEEVIGRPAALTRS
jgi:hypothetical protein